MARGRVPKDILNRPRDTARREAEMTELVDTGQLAGLPLPEGVLPDGESWHPQTLAFWDGLRRSPLMADEPSLSWLYLIDTAVLHHLMWQHGRWQHAAEIRLRAAKFAVTPEDRQRLRVRVTQPARQEPSGSDAVTNIAFRRCRLTT
jgi:hypothetical protein